mmetsp:Transcript_10433/g.10472  ORF Transcript_10433/g.10472 Transcript_10433/m.10472 type:complete len:713 (+) Transcript_10433:10-2148(+)
MLINEIKGSVPYLLLPPWHQHLLLPLHLSVFGLPFQVDNDPRQLIIGHLLQTRVNVSFNCLQILISVLSDLVVRAEALVEDAEASPYPGGGGIEVPIFLVGQGHLSVRIRRLRMVKAQNHFINFYGPHEVLEDFVDADILLSVVGVLCGPGLEEPCQPNVDFRHLNAQFQPDLLETFEGVLVEVPALHAELVLSDGKGLVPPGVLRAAFLLVPAFELLRELLQDLPILIRGVAIDLLAHGTGRPIQLRSVLPFFSPHHEPLTSLALRVLDPSVLNDEVEASRVLLLRREQRHGLLPIIFHLGRDALDVFQSEEVRVPVFVLLEEVDVPHVHIQLDPQLLANVEEQRRQVHLPQNVSLQRHLVLLLGMVRDEVPDIMDGSLSVLIRVEDLQDVVEDAFMDVIFLEARFLIIGEEGEAISDEYLGAPGNDFNDSHLPLMVELGKGAELAEVSHADSSGVEEDFQLVTGEGVLLHIVEVLQHPFHDLVLDLLPRPHILILVVHPLLLVPRVANAQVRITVQRNLLELRLRKLLPAAHVLVEWPPVLLRHLLPHDLVHWVLKTLRRQQLRVAVHAAVVLHQQPLLLLHAPLLKVEVLVLLYEVVALVALFGALPGEVDGVRGRLPAMIPYHRLRPQLLAHHLKDAQLVFFEGVDEAFVGGEEADAVDEVDLHVALHVKVLVELDGVGEMALLEHSSGFLFDEVGLQVEELGDLLTH